MQLTNCGLIALEKLSTIKNISAFTLIHAARDNDLNLYFFKVNDLADLARVTRPAIFHQKNHFVIVKNSEAMPDGEYTGHVIGPAVLGRVLSMAEAKTVTGGKNFLTGENKDGVKEGGGALGSILGVVGGIVGSIILPGIGTALGGSLSSAAGGAIGGAIGGGVGAGVTGDNALLGAGLGAIGGGAIGGGIAGLGAASSATGANIGSKISGFTQGAFNTLSHPIASLGAGGNAIATGGIPSLASETAAFGGGVAPFSAPGAVTGAGNLAGATAAFGGGVAPLNAAANAASVGTNPIFSSTANSFTPNSAFSLSNIPSLTNATTGASGAAGVAGGASKAASSANGSFNPLLAGAGALGVFGSKAPTPQGDAVGNYSAAQTFLEPNALATPTSNQLLQYVNTPISDLQTQFSANNDRTLNTINTAYDNQRQQLVHQYAQAGQNLANSSELQDKVGQLEQKRTNDLTLAQQETHDQALSQAIQVKQSALSNALQQGQYDQNLALDLAKLTGDDQALQYAIANNDYQTFQSIMGKILTAGLPNQVPASTGINLKLA